MQTFWPNFYNDLRYALRHLRNRSVFAMTAVLTLAIGIGATIGVYTLVDAVLLRPLPYRDPGKVLVLESKGDQEWYNFVNLADVEELTRRSQGRFQTAAIINEAPANLGGVAAGSAASVVKVTTNMMPLLGVQPELGRGFRADENEPGKEHVMLLSDQLWHEAFNANPDVLGKAVTAHGESYIVIGIMPRGFSVPMDETAVWVPAAIPAAAHSAFGGKDAIDANMFFLRADPKLKPAMSLAQVNAEVTRLQMQIAQEHGSFNLPKNLSCEAYLTRINHGVKKPLLLLLGMGASFWLLASLNVVSLLIARAIAREREFAVRSALGASRARLLRQSVVESLLLSALSSALGLLLATATTKLLWPAIEKNLPLTARIHVEARVVLTLIAVSIITGVVVGLLPALRASGSNVQDGLRGGASPLPRIEQQRLRSTLIATQLMITLVLLGGAGLFLRTVYALRTVPLGFSQQNVLTGGIIMHPNLAAGKAAATRDVVTQVYEPLLEQLNHLPGATSATLSTVLPMRADFAIALGGRIDGKDLPKGQEYIAQGRAATPGLPETFGISMLRGRFFSSEDTPASPHVIVVNDAFGRTFLRGEDPIGHSFGFGKAPYAAMRIVGVIGDVKQGDVTKLTKPEVYLCLSQIKQGDDVYGLFTDFIQVGMRASIPAQLLSKEFENLLHHVDPDAQLIDVKTVHEAVEDSFGSQALMAHLLEGFAVIALVIALVGLYGTIAFSVAQRTREFGVRLALGAPQESITRLVIRQAMWPVIGGLGGGYIVLWFATRLVGSYLFGIQPHDTVTLIIASLTLLLTGMVAAFVPARRAASIDPMNALRTE